MRKISLVLILCSISFLSNAQKKSLIDKKATAETKALFQNLDKLAENHILFGHQHSTEYGHGWQGDEDRSDVKSVCGSHAAIIGVDLMGFSDKPAEEIAKYKEDTRKNIVDTYNRGGVTTLSWHFSNPVSAGGFYWKDSVSLPAVKYIIPGGAGHQKYKEMLTSIGEWSKTLKGKDGKLVPVIFRPYHEFDGDWFWWGKPHCTKEEFIQLWQFTVSYLRDTLNVHNFIYAFSPDNRFNSEAEFVERYPGNEWVDLLGMDNYGDFGRDRYDLVTASAKLKIVSDFAEKSGKLAALTETGLESIPNKEWWTGTLLKVLKMHKMKLCYVLVWRNDVQSPTHYYAPYPGQVSVTDFMKFYDTPYVFFEKDLINIYNNKFKPDLK